MLMFILKSRFIYKYTFTFICREFFWKAPQELATVVPSGKKAGERTPISVRKETVIF